MCWGSLAIGFVLGLVVGLVILVVTAIKFKAIG